MTGRKAIIIFSSWKLLSLSLECTWSYKNMELSHKGYFCIWYFYLYSFFLCNNIYEWRYTLKACRKRLMLSFYMKRPSHVLNCVSGDSSDDIYIHAPIVLQNRHVQSFFAASLTYILLSSQSFSNVVFYVLLSSMIIIQISTKP